MLGGNLTSDELYLIGLGMFGHCVVVVQPRQRVDEDVEQKSERADVVLCF